MLTSKQLCLPDLFFAQAERRPYETAVVENSKSLTFEELRKISTALAFSLQQKGVTPDDCIGLYMDSSIETIVGVWGILIAGGAYLPLSTEYPKARLKFMVENSNTRVIITRERLRGNLLEFLAEDVQIVTLNDIEECNDPGHHELSELVSNLKPNNLAYVIYTSGSTGTPKGVMIEHRSIVHQLNWLQATYAIDESKSILQKTPISFDAAQWEILAVACGVKVVMGGDGIHRNPQGIIETLKKQNITTLQCVPTLLQALVNTDAFKECKSLTQVFCGGEALSRKLANQFFNILEDCELINLYGPSECTINASSFLVERARIKGYSNMIPIGYPAEGTCMVILKDDLSPVGHQEVGEIYIGGQQLARGYMNRPDLTADRFVSNPIKSIDYPVLYKTGDRGQWNGDGSIQFTGRVDGQVKLRGYRVELDEIRIAIENHNWVKSAALAVQQNPVSETNSLVAFVELDPNEARLMDQGNHGHHHQSKESKLQLKAQLSNLGCRVFDANSSQIIVNLPGKEASKSQIDFAFARKTYRFYKGGTPSKSDILNLLNAKKEVSSDSKPVGKLTLQQLGELLRYFGQFKSPQRLLPKYTYASPGALNATQLYIDLQHTCGLVDGIYYYHPIDHQLTFISQSLSRSQSPQFRLHFLGKKQAIEPVYKDNIREVLEMEVGHMLGVFEKILPEYGLFINNGCFMPAIKPLLKSAEEDYYLGTFDVIPFDQASFQDDVNLYFQPNTDDINGLPTGTYFYHEGDLTRISEKKIQKKHVIAINQQVYDRSSIGISLVSKSSTDWRQFIVLGKKLQHLQMNSLGFGFMPSGYSSQSGCDLPSAVQIRRILSREANEIGQSYFCVGGLVSEQQISSQGMYEDMVHMKGPVELLKDDLMNKLPHFMIPDSIVIVDEMPYTPNRKIDQKVIQKLAEKHLKSVRKEIVPPNSKAEKQIADFWKEVMRIDKVSIHDNFFETGGNSITAVALLHKIKENLHVNLPIQVLFESPTIEGLANMVEAGNLKPMHRLVHLQHQGSGSPVYCWSGLGGYTMNLKLLAEKMGTKRPFYGVQSLGLNEGEKPCDTIEEMAAVDIIELKARQPKGPYTLWGFSFGARLAFETCFQLEKGGDVVENLVLIAPGSPKVWIENDHRDSDSPTFDNKAFVVILFSVFAGTIDHPKLDECLETIKDEEGFAAFICSTFDHLNLALVKRIIKVVSLTYQFKYTFRELRDREIKAPIVIFKARGDDYSFLESETHFSLFQTRIVELNGDHYQILKEPYIDELISHIRENSKEQGAERHDTIGVRQQINQLSTKNIISMPHVDIKHFPVDLDETSKQELLVSIVSAVKKTFRCEESAISIALEPVEAQAWDNLVYNPQILRRQRWLLKRPGYGVLAKNKV
jgi:amino acid adenylation domain-containing protein